MTHTQTKSHLIAMQSALSGSQGQQCIQSHALPERPFPSCPSFLHFQRGSWSPELAATFCFISSPVRTSNTGILLVQRLLEFSYLFFFFLKHWCGLKLNWNSDLLKGSVCIWHVEKEISHPAPMFVFPPSIFVVVKRGEQNGLCIFVGPKTRCKEIKKIGNQWMPFEVFCV